MLGHLQAMVIKFRLIYLQGQKRSGYDTVLNFLNDNTLVPSKIPQAFYPQYLTDDMSALVTN